MKKTFKYISKYSVVIIFSILLIAMITLIAVGVSSGKAGLSFIPDNKSEYCYDIQTISDGNLSDYKNISKISEFASQTPIRNVNITYFAQYEDAKDPLTVYGGNDGKAFAINWNNNEDSYKAELYISINIDGKNGDSFRKDIFTVDYEIDGSTLTINIHPNNINLHTYDNSQLLKDTTDYDFNHKLKIQFYTRITN